MRHLGRPSILGAVLAGSLLLGAAPATAEVTIGVSPAILELEGRAGDAGRIQITVSNQGDERYEAVTDLVSFESMAGDHSAVEWGRVTPERLRLDPGESAAITLALDIPDDARSNGRYAAVTVATALDGSGSGPGLAARILVPVFLTVHGKGDLDRTTAVDRSALFLESDGRLGFRVQVRNDGNVHVPIAGSVTIASREPAIDASLALVGGRVLPQRSRTYAGDATLPLPLDATYDVVVRLGAGDEDGRMVGEPVHTQESTVEASVDLALESAAVCENLDRGPSMTATLRNAGTLGVIPRVDFAVTDAAGSSVGTVPATEQTLAWPGETTVYGADLRTRLNSGDHTLVVTATYGGGQTQELRVPFSIGGEAATAAPLCEPLAPSPSPAA